MKACVAQTMRSPLSTGGERRWASCSRATVTSKSISGERQKGERSGCSSRWDSRRGNKAVQRDFSAHAETVETAERGGERQLKASAGGDILLTTLDNLEAGLPSAVLKQPCEGARKERMRWTLDNDSLRDAAEWRLHAKNAFLDRGPGLDGDGDGHN
jgi:hypothetical protein